MVGEAICVCKDCFAHFIFLVGDKKGKISLTFRDVFHRMRDDGYFRIKIPRKPNADYAFLGGAHRVPSTIIREA